MNILVLGAGGFIATHLVTRVKSQGHTVWAIDLKYPEYSTTDADHFLIGDLSEYSTFMRIADQRFDEVYQLAADMGGALYIFTGDNDSVIMKNNVQINLNLLKYLKEKESLEINATENMFAKKDNKTTRHAERTESN